MKTTTELGDCKGFAVHTAEGRVGSLAAVLPPRAASGGSGALLVQDTPLSCALSTVSVEQIEAVDREARRIVVRSPR